MNRLPFRIFYAALKVWGMCAALVMVARMGGVLVPEGTQLAFAALEADMTITIYLADLTRNLIVPLVFEADRALSFSTEREMLFSQDTAAEMSAIFRLEGGAHHQLSPDGVRDQSPVWSPDGQQVAFISKDGEDNRLYVMNADGSGRRHLANDNCPNILTVPLWLPDSRRILFRYGEPEVELACVIDSVTGETWDFSHDTEIHALPIWSPDGGRIAYAYETPTFAHIYTAEVIEREVTNIQRLTASNQSFDTSPRWSPDGRQIAFISNRSGSRDVYVMDVDGGNLRNLSQSYASDFFPLWSPDGGSIAFISNEGGSWGITLMAVDGTDARRIAAELNVRPVLMVWLP